MFVFEIIAVIKILHDLPYPKLQNSIPVTEDQIVRKHYLPSAFLSTIYEREREREERESEREREKERERRERERGKKRGEREREHRSRPRPY